MNQGVVKLCDVIRRRREDLGMSAEELAHRLGIRNGGYIERVERGYQQMLLAKIPVMADALELNTSELCKLALFEYDRDFFAGMFGDEVPEWPRRT